MIEGQNTGDSAQALTVDSAASVLEGLFSDDSEETQTETHSDDETPEAQSSTEDEEDSESQSEDQSDEGDEEESESSTDDEDESDDEAEQPQKFKVKVQDQEHEVTLDELLKGYSRTEDYTRKTQKLADDRKKFDSEAQPEREALRAERQRYATNLTELESALTALVQEPDWDKLRMESPDLFADAWAAWDQHSKRLGKLAEERAAAVAEVEKDLTAKEKQRLAGERDRLLEALPSWADKAVAKKESDEILAYGKTLGFAEDEIKNVSDHRALVALRKAMLFDRAEADKAKAKQTAKAKIEKVKTVAPGAKGGKPKVNEATRAKQRHAKVGSVKSAADALTLMFED